MLDDLGLRCGKGRFPAEPQLHQAPVAETVPRGRFRHVPAQGEIKLSPWAGSFRNSESIDPGV